MRSCETHPCDSTAFINVQLDAASGEQKKAVQVRVDAAATRVDKYTQRISAEAGGGSASGNGGQPGRPRVEVGCLEEVLVSRFHLES